MEIEISEKEVRTIKEYQEAISKLYDLMPSGGTDNSRKLQSALAQITGFNPYESANQSIYPTEKR